MQQQELGLEVDFESLGLDEEEQQQAKEYIQSLTVVNLDESDPEPIDVVLREYVPETYTDESGRQRTRNKLVRRTAHIETFVPHDLFIKTLKLQERMDARRNGKNFTAEELEGLSSKVTDFVLRAWQLTEPDMTLQQLTQGLRFQKIQELFLLFFGGQTPRSASKV